MGPSPTLQRSVLQNYRVSIGSLQFEPNVAPVIRARTQELITLQFHNLNAYGELCIRQFA